VTKRVLGIEGCQGGSHVRVVRPEGMEDALWMAVRAELNADGRDSAREVVVPVERFMARLEPFVTRCKGLGLDATLDDQVRSMAREATETRAELRDALTAHATLGRDEIGAVLRPSRYSRELRDFQVADSGRLLAISHGANFSVPGAGKTAVALAVYEAERIGGRVAQMLVVGPLSAFGSWVDECDECFVEPPPVRRYQGDGIPDDAEILLVNYQRLAASFDALAAWVATRPTLVLLDEAHRMKRGWTGEWGSACLSLAYIAERRDVLTGTPAPQSPRDFVALLDFLWPNSAARILPPEALVAQPPRNAGALVADAIRPLFVRTKKSDLGLPPVTFSALAVPMTELHRDIYDALRDLYAGTLSLPQRDRVDFAGMGRVVMYLLEAATNPALLAAGSEDDADPEAFRHPPLQVPPESALADVLRAYRSYDTPRKFIELGGILKRNAELGRKTLVWSSFVRNLRTMDKMLAKYKPAVIHGGVPAYSSIADERSRDTEIKRFRGDAECMVLLANPAAMSEGISLHKDCHDAVYLDRTFNAGHYLQSVDRIHRLGLAPDQETRITFLLSEGTVDEIVDARVRVKAVRLGEMLDDPDLASVALPDDEDYGAVIDSVEDIAALFAHLRGETPV